MLDVGEDHEAAVVEEAMGEASPHGVQVHRVALRPGAVRNQQADGVRENHLMDQILSKINNILVEVAHGQNHHINHHLTV